MTFLIRRLNHQPSVELDLTRKEFLYIIAMIILDIAAPIFLLLGLSMTTSANASLLNNFEIVATSLIALFIFHEQISPRLWLGILLISGSCMLLSFEDITALHFSTGSLFVLLAASCWGLENNCTRSLSNRDPLEIVLLKGIFSETASVIIGLIIGERLTACWSIPLVLLLGFVAYGLSIYYYVYAQRELGASRTSAYYAIVPFIAIIINF